MCEHLIGRNRLSRWVLCSVLTVLSFCCVTAVTLFYFSAWSSPRFAPQCRRRELRSDPFLTREESYSTVCASISSRGNVSTLGRCSCLAAGELWALHAQSLGHFDPHYHVEWLCCGRCRQTMSSFLEGLVSLYVLVFWNTTHLFVMNMWSVSRICFFAGLVRHTVNSLRTNAKNEAQCYSAHLSSCWHACMTAVPFLLISLSAVPDLSDAHYQSTIMQSRSSAGD